MNYLKRGLSGPKDDLKEQARPLTPLSERPRNSYGSLLSSLQTTPGLCARGVKCCRKAHHAGDCWPSDA